MFQKMLLAPVAAVLVLAAAAMPAGAKEAQYRIMVTTGTANDAGTDANVYITIYGSKGNSRERTLDNNADDFENGQTDAFTITDSDLGDLQRIRIRHDNSGHNPGWFLDRVVIQNEETGQEWVFPCNRWLAKDEDDGKIDRVLYVKK